MGLMLGEFVDDYTVRVVDVFAMPQSGTGVSVEAVDPVFQTKMMEMLRQTGRPETVVGWYHSHPGFGCWLSSVDINTQQSFEQLTPRAVAVVVDPIQSVKGKVVIDAFRLINPQTLMMGHEPRQTTSNLGHLNKPSIQALIHGLNRHYYSIAINYRKTGLEENMLMNLHKHVWTEALEMPDFRLEGGKNNDRLQKLVLLAEGYERRVKEESELTKDQLKTRYVGKVDPKKRKCMLRGVRSDIRRHRRHRAAAHRGQHRRRVAADDRQGGIGAGEGLALQRADQRGDGNRRGAVE
jgi:26S proteasome regulatory subunit N11